MAAGLRVGSCAEPSDATVANTNATSQLRRGLFEVSMLSSCVAEPSPGRSFRFQVAPRLMINRAALHHHTLQILRPETAAFKLLPPEQEAVHRRGDAVRNDGDPQCRDGASKNVHRVVRAKNEDRGDFKEHDPDAEHR